MKLILYHVFGEKFIAFLILLVILEGILFIGICVYWLARIALDEFPLRKHHPRE